MNEVNQVLQQIYWCSESMHSSRQMTTFIMERSSPGIFKEIVTGGRFHGQPLIMNLIYHVFLNYAESRIAYLQLLDSGDCLLIPTINPHLLVNHCKAAKPIKRHSAIAGQRVGFTLWDGEGAPDNLFSWTGLVKQKQPMFSGGPIEYVLERDADGQLIKLTREFLVPLQS